MCRPCQPSGGSVEAEPGRYSRYDVSVFIAVSRYSAIQRRDTAELCCIEIPLCAHVMRTVSDVSRCIGDRYIRGWCELRCEGNDLMWIWCAGCCWEVSGSVFCAEGVFKHSSSRSSSRHPSHQTSLHSHRYSRFLLYSSHHVLTEVCCIACDTAAIQQ